jgi:hypothetical protein
MTRLRLRKHIGAPQPKASEANGECRVPASTHAPAAAKQSGAASGYFIMGVRTPIFFTQLFEISRKR